MKVEVNGERMWQRCVHKERPFLPHRLLFVDIYQHLHCCATATLQVDCYRNTPNYYTIPSLK